MIHIFSRCFSDFSGEFSKWSYLHHPSTNVFKSSVKVKHDFLLEWILPMRNLFISCTDSTSTNPVPVVAMSLTHLIWHMVSVKMRIPSHPSDLSLEYDHVEDWMLWRWEKSLWEGSQGMPALTKGNGHMLEKGHPWSFPLVKCHETQCIHLASDAPASSDMWGKVWATKATENNWLHKKWKIQLLPQQEAIAIWPAAAEHGYSIHRAKRFIHRAIWGTCSLDYALRRRLRSTPFQRSLFTVLMFFGLQTTNKILH